MEKCKCIQEGEIASIKTHLKNLHKRVDSVEDINKNLNTLTTSVAVMATEMKGTNEKLDKLSTDVEELKEEDSNNYKYFKRQITSKVILTVTGAILGALLALIIKGGM